MSGGGTNVQAISRGTTLRAVATACVLGLGALAVRGLQSAMNATFDKPPAPLRRELGEVSRALGGRYEAFETDENLDPEMVQSLGTTDYLLRRYQDKTVARGALGNILRLNVNYYPTGSAWPHVPEICWAGAGRVAASDSRVFFTVKDVPRADGSRIDLKMRMISFAPLPGDARAAGANDTGLPVYINVAYVFHVNGDYVSSPQEVVSRFWKATNRFAYHAKIEMTPTDEAGRPMACTREQAEAVVSDFIKAALPELETCFPDPATLRAR